MKKTLIVLAFLAALFVTEEAQAQLNIHAGYAPELMYTKTPTYDTTLFYHGIYFGVDWKFNLSKNFSLTAGAQYRINLRDDAEHYWMGDIFVHHTIRERQTLIDIPVFIHYGIPAGSSVTISPFIGPMLSWGITGKTSETITWPINTDTNHEWYGENGYMSRFNLYGVAGLEIDFNKFILSLGGRYGFLNPNKKTGTTTKAYGFFLNFGYTF